MIRQTGCVRGSKVLLRALCRDDLGVLAAFVNDPAVMRYSNVYAPIHDIAQERWYEGIAASRNSIWFGICDARSELETLVGTCCLVEIDSIARQAELRIRIGDPGVWGAGLGTEATTLLIDYGFNEQNLERIWLRVFSGNERAVRLYERTGFKLEGRLRRAAFIGGSHHDVLLMGLLRDEWKPKGIVPGTARGTLSP